MSFKVKVVYIDEETDSVKKLFFPRVIRRLSSGLPGINYRGKVFRALPFKADNIDLVLFDKEHPDEKPEKLKDCPFVTVHEAKEMLENLVPSAHEYARTIEYGRYIDQEKDQSIPNIVYADPVIAHFHNRLTDQEITSQIIPQIHYHKPNPPQFNSDWFIERTKWYVYVLVNNDGINNNDSIGNVFYSSNQRIDFISDALENPSKFKLVDSAYFHMSSLLLDPDEVIQPSIPAKPIPQPCLTSFKEVILNQPVKISDHKTLHEKWGDIDFEERDSIRPSVNGVMYDHWFRFDLSFSNEVLADLFNDIFSIYNFEHEIPNILSTANPYSMLEQSFVLPNIYLTPPDLPRPETKIDHKLWTQELESENEFFSKANAALEKKLEKVTLDYVDAEQKILVLINDIERSKERQKKQINNTLKTFFGQEIIFLRRGIKVLRNFESPDGVYKILQQLIRDESGVPKKTVERTSHWLEVAKKINTGKDEQGRIYIYKTNSNPTRFVVLVGHKLDQKSDIEYLRKNDPPKEWDK